MCQFPPHVLSLSRQTLFGVIHSFSQILGSHSFLEALQGQWPEGVSLLSAQGPHFPFQREQLVNPGARGSETQT